ncbi:hypothetical protein T4C_6195 [Trichinella pseudospiralis]|uniref:Uncharacterized protein n=1 Tax=Trichinella pseudospiralis TaxID=6337 RepID=A0A0V1JVC5_TRIPS|nr:hypothetical protein T4C_6195 [Trichinella pseudospiralis]
MYNQCQWGLKKRGIIYCFKLAGSVSNPIFENKIKEHKLPFFKNLSTVHISECDVSVNFLSWRLILYESILNNLELDFFGVILVNE